MEDRLIEIIKKSESIMKSLEILKESCVSKYDYYLAGGAIYKTIFNYLHGYNLDNGINDFDIIYFDDADMSYEAEDKIIKALEQEFKMNKFQIKLDIKNEARAHIWLKENYNEEVEKYKNIDQALRSWGFSACAIGIRLEKNRFILAEPYGLEDLFAMKIRKVGNYDITKKARELKNIWPNIDISLVE